MANPEYVDAWSNIGKVLEKNVKERKWNISFPFLYIVTHDTERTIKSLIARSILHIIGIIFLNQTYFII